MKREFRVRPLLKESNKHTLTHKIKTKSSEIKISSKSKYLLKLTHMSLKNIWRTGMCIYQGGVIVVGGGIFFLTMFTTWM